MNSCATGSASAFSELLCTLRAGIASGTPREAISGIALVCIRSFAGAYSACILTNNSSKAGIPVVNRSPRRHGERIIARWISVTDAEQNYDGRT